MMQGDTGSRGRNEDDGDDHNAATVGGAEDGRVKLPAIVLPPQQQQQQQQLPQLTPTAATQGSSSGSRTQSPLLQSPRVHSPRSLLPPIQSPRGAASNPQSASTKPTLVNNPSANTTNSSSNVGEAGGGPLGKQDVVDWLVAHGLSDTISAMHKEMEKNASSATSQNYAALKSNILEAFTRGDGDAFFSLLQTHVEPTAESHPDHHKQLTQINFLLHIYFAIFPIHPITRARAVIPRTQTMETFKQYLDKNGNAAATASGHFPPDYLSYYALPFVPNPERHPSFESLFTSSWIQKLEQKLEEALNKIFQVSEQPTPGTENGVLASVTMKLLDALFSGVTLPQAKLTELYQSAKSYLPRDYSPPKPYLHSSTTDIGSPRQPPPNPVPTPKQHTALENLQLDYKKINTDLITLGEIPKCLLLQALNWRLSRTSGVQSNTTLTGLIQNDFLGIKRSGPKTVLSNLLGTHSSNLIQDYTCRVINTLTVEWAGKEYLSLSTDLIPLLFEILQNAPLDSILQQQSLAALQKLSLRRAAQSTMIKTGCIEWILDILISPNTLSKHTLVYSMALLMNLSQRNLGQSTCENSTSPDAVAILMNLLSHSDSLVRLYTHGCLFSLLGRAAIRYRARSLGLPRILSQKVTEPTTSEDELKQLEYILGQFNLPEEPEDDDELDDSDDDAADICDRGNAVPENPNATWDAEDLTETVTASGNSPQGDELLLLSYSHQPASDLPIRNPVRVAAPPARSGAATTTSSTTTKLPTPRYNVSGEPPYKSTPGGATRSQQVMFSNTLPRTAAGSIHSNIGSGLSQTQPLHRTPPRATGTLPTYSSSSTTPRRQQQQFHL
ncbi:ARM protein [Pelomyxa schiedti]|nr:ARM protein [Pelomyxa schiedti]